MIAPFNFPLILSIRSVAPALALGNAVILKPDPRTAVCGGVVLARVFEEAGLPAGRAAVLPGGAEVGEAMVADPAVRVIAFTGSTAAGRAVGELAGQHLKRAHLELGGNTALIVLDDADVTRRPRSAPAASSCTRARSAWPPAGTWCTSRSPRSTRRLLAGRPTTLPVGDPAAGMCALGPLIDAGQRDRVHGLVTASVDGGRHGCAPAAPTRGCSTGPRCSADVRRTPRPTTRRCSARSRRSTPFSTLDEAVAAGHRHRIRPVAGHPDRATCMPDSQLAERIPTGAVHINDQTVATRPRAPFGGVGASGTCSRYGGAAANIEAFTETRWITAQPTPPAYPF